MNPADLLAPSSPVGFPAPLWFLVLFKVIGFTLHISMMNIWYAGPIIAMLLYLRGGHPRRLAGRVMKAMPIIIAFGINFGIVPLLFVQVAYYKVFYPSSILMAWPWMAIIVLLTFAYYGTYIYAVAMKKNQDYIAPIKLFAGWVAAVFFIIIGFLFANEFSLMTNLDTWPQLWQNSNVGGAVTGTMLNTGDPTFWPRWLMMFGLAITTTSTFFAVDTGLFAGRESEDYKRWAASFAFKPYLFGIAWFIGCAVWYVFGAWPVQTRQFMFSGSTIGLTLLAGGAIIIPIILLIVCARGKRISKGMAIGVGVTQFAVLAFNAISRQVAQNFELARYFDITSEKVNTQIGPLITFLIVFIAGVGLLIWMIRQAVKSVRQASSGPDTA